MNKPFIIAITGAESTGKSTLAGALSHHYGVPFISEFARDYVRSLRKSYTFEDVDFIAKKQVEQYNELNNSNYPLVILDTWLLITKVWFSEVYHRIPDWIDESIQKYRVDLFLVCDTDLPWVADDVRENGGKNRNRLQQVYIEEIKKNNFRYEIVKGSGEKRIQNAIECIEAARFQNQHI